MLVNDKTINYHILIFIKVYHDVNTPKPFKEDLSVYHKGLDPQADCDAKVDHVYADAMGFGMGLACLQVTFQVGCVSCLGESWNICTLISVLFPLGLLHLGGTCSLRSADHPLSHRHGAECSYASSSRLPPRHWLPLGHHLCFSRRSYWRRTRSQGNFLCLLTDKRQLWSLAQ